MQKQVSDVNITKSYASVASPPGPSTSGMSNNGTHDHSKDHDHYTVSEATPDRHKGKIQSTGNTGDSSLVDVNTFNSHANESLNSSTPADKSHTAKHKPTLEKSYDSTFGSRDKSTSENSDVFVGVTYKRNARYYLSGIGPKSTKEGIVRYIESRGATVSHFVLFKPKFSGRRLTAKVNVAPRDADLIESEDFWPDGVQCRRWYSVRQWEEMCTNRNAQYEDWEADDNDGYE